ncbi:hypothetical protein AVEN_167444-1 [Araneus ventricosus]|uniref:Uncharacterized protein n=1 Tax=Araneus ventricosus TaxID=182803 RepID=A0A4Y2ENR5_ARAVE|nr:hypothetical protein AVEN_167444-1 [Araneus ventricosus]
MPEALGEVRHALKTGDARSPGVILSRLSGANGVERKNVYESRDPSHTLPASILILRQATLPSPPHPSPESMIQEEIGKFLPNRVLSNFSDRAEAARDCHRNIPEDEVSG